MLTADSRIKVVDFGIAGFTHTHAHTFTVVPTSMLAPAGTALYGAPEQFLDQRGDERSDLYALGSVLFALLTGKPPFGDGSPLSVIRRKLDDEAPLLSSLRPDAPETVAQLLTELLQRDPDQRPHSASVVYERLEQLRPSATMSDTAARESETERPPRTPPTRILTGETAATEGAFEITWTGKDPISSYATSSRRSLRRHWLLFAVLAWPFLHAWLVFVLLVTSNDPHDTQLSDIPVAVCVGSVLYPILLYLLYGRHLGAATLGWGRHQRALKDRRPWSLRVDAAGITTRDPRQVTPVGGPAGHRVYDWSLVVAVTLEHASEFRWAPATLR